MYYTGGMENIAGLRDLNHRPGALLRQVTETNTLVITENGVPRWRVIPYVEDPSANSLDAMALRGILRRSTAEFTPPKRHHSQAGSSEQILDELRGEW